MNTSTLAQKLWSYGNVLRDGGMSYGDYVEQRTYAFLANAFPRFAPGFADDHRPPRHRQPSRGPCAGPTPLPSHRDRTFNRYCRRIRAISRPKSSAEHHDDMRKSAFQYREDGVRLSTEVCA